MKNYVTQMTFTMVYTNVQPFLKTREHTTKIDIDTAEISLIMMFFRSNQLSQRFKCKQIIDFKFNLWSYIVKYLTD